MFNKVDRAKCCHKRKDGTCRKKHESCEGCGDFFAEGAHEDCKHYDGNRCAILIERGWCGAVRYRHREDGSSYACAWYEKCVNGKKRKRKG